MVILNRIYTRTGDDGTTSLGSGERRKKYDFRVEAYGTLDEVNATIGLVRLHTADDAVLDPVLGRIQNDLFDVEADLCLSEKGPGGARLTVTDAQVDWLEGSCLLLRREALEQVGPLDERFEDRFVAVGDEQGELVAAEPGGNVATSKRPAQLGPDGPEGGVAGGVTEAVVDTLEVVQVEKDQREGPSVPLGVGHGLGEHQLV